MVGIISWGSYSYSSSSCLKVQGVFAPFEKILDVSWRMDISDAIRRSQNYVGVMTILSIVRMNLKIKQVIYITSGFLTACRSLWQ